MKRFGLTMVFTLIAMLYCCAQIQVFPLTEQNVRIKKNSCIYYLPQTTLEIRVKVTKETLIPGPFYKYAEKYLCIKKYIKACGKEWLFARLGFLIFPLKKLCLEQCSFIVPSENFTVIFSSP